MGLDLNDPDLYGETPPSVLYHYTDAAGLTGIVESKLCLKATDHRLVNDSAEIEFGRAIALDVLKGLDGVDPEVMDEATAGLSELLEGHLFLACLSTSQNILPQWRLYANETAGYCVGFKNLRSAAYHDEEGNYPLTYDLYRCWYDEAELRDRLVERYRRKIGHVESERYRRTIGRIESVTTVDKNKVLAQELALVGWRYSQLGKHEHFKFESEWRFVVRAPEEFIHYRLSGRGLTPYAFTETLDLAEVWIGPGVGPTPEKAHEAVTAFLGKHGLSPQVMHWKTSYRR